jgi:glycosyltransferase involved in cell wall biosynthesis
MVGRSLDILFIVPYVPSLVRVRPYNLIRHLAKRGHRVSVLTLWTNQREYTELETLRQIAHQVEGVYLSRMRSFWNAFMALPSSQPLQSVYCWHPEIVEKLKRASHSRKDEPPFDVVHIEHLRGAHYGLAIKDSIQDGYRQIPVVWDSVDSISLLFRQAASHGQGFLGKWLTRFELGRTEPYEGWLATQFDRVLVTSPHDREALLELLPESQKNRREKDLQIDVLQNGVDLDYFKPDPKVKRKTASIIVSGKMSYHANVTMALNLVNTIMPHVWKKRPDVDVSIVGKHPPREILALAQDTRVEVTGTVDDIRPWLQSATVAAVPIIYGTGIQNKVLEAMAASTPVVSTSKAVSALEVEVGQDILVADETEDFAKELLCLIDDPGLCREIGASGRRYVERWHRWESVAAELEAIYYSAIQSTDRG